MCKFFNNHFVSRYLPKKRESSVTNSLGTDCRWRGYRRLWVAILSGLLISSFSLNSVAKNNNPGHGHDMFRYGKYNNHGNHTGHGSSMEPIVIQNMSGRCAALLNDKLPKPGLSVNLTEVRDIGLPTEHCFVSFTFTLPGGETVFTANHAFPKTFSKRFIHIGGGGYWPGLFGDIHDSSFNVSLLGEGMAVGSFGGDIYNDLTWVIYDHYSEAYRAMARDGVYYSTVIAKALLKDFYGISPRYSYFSACSRGGQQGLAQALYHPDAFDGIAVGAPAFVTQVLSGLAPRYKDGLLSDGPNYPLYSGDLGIKVANAIKHQCDGQDGTADNTISNPASCDPDFTSIFADLGLTSEQQRLVLDAFVSHSYTGTPLNSNYGTVTVNEFGYPMTMPTYPLVADNNWLFVDGWTVLDPNADPAINGDWGAVVFGHLLGLDFNSQAFANTLADIAVSPVDGLFFSDLNAFSRQGGKLVLVHTWPDSLLPITHTIGWVDKQKELFKSHKNKPLSNTMRFFTADSGGHCDFDLAETLKATQDWVEQGKAPETLRVRAFPYDRPACQFPKVAVRTNPNANVLDYNSYSCLTPEEVDSSVVPVPPIGTPTVADGIAVYNNQPSSTFNGHEYKYVNVANVNNTISTLRYSWTDSRSICQGLGAGWDLATIHSQAENDFITNTVMGPEGYIGYLGGIYNYGDNKWYWIGDPNPFWIGYVDNVNQGFNGIFANWNGPQITSSANNNEPNHYNGLPEDYVAIFGNGGIPGWGLSGHWMDTADNLNPASPVCEK